MTVSANAAQAVANDDFEGFVREANKADLEAKLGPAKAAKVEEPPIKVESKAEPEKKSAEEIVVPPKKGFGSLSPREMRAKLREQDAELERLKAAKPAEPKEVAKVEVKAEPEKARIRPQSDDKNEKGEAKYKTWTEYEDDLLAWNEEKLLAKIDERDSKKREEAQVEAANKTIEHSWKERVEKSRETHEDYDDVALDPEVGPGKLIGPGSIVDRWILESEHGAELLYLFGKNPEKLRQFEKVANSADAYRRLAKLEDEIVAAREKDKKDEVKDEIKSKPVEKETPRATKTPKPASEVGGRGNTLPDPVAAAVADGSDEAVGRYIAEQNRREIRERFGDRGR